MRSRVVAFALPLLLVSLWSGPVGATPDDVNPPEPVDDTRIRSGTTGEANDGEDEDGEWSEAGGAWEDYSEGCCACTSEGTQASGNLALLLLMGVAGQRLRRRE